LNRLTERSPFPWLFRAVTPSQLAIASVMTAAVSFVQAGIGFGSLLLAAPLLVLVGEFELLLGVTLIPGTVAGYVPSPPFVRWLDRGYTRAAVLGVSIGAGLLLILRRLA
jgi:hypothetical protein